MSKANFLFDAPAEADSGTDEGSESESGSESGADTDSPQADQPAVLQSADDQQKANALKAKRKLEEARRHIAKATPEQQASWLAEDYVACTEASLVEQAVIAGEP